MFVNWVPFWYNCCDNKLNCNRDIDNIILVLECFSTTHFDLDIDMDNFILSLFTITLKSMFKQVYLKKINQMTNYFIKNDIKFENLITNFFNSSYH
jgi:hypothetical protein